MKNPLFIPLCLLLSGLAFAESPCATEELYNADANECYVHPDNAHWRFNAKSGSDFECDIGFLFDEENFECKYDGVTPLASKKKLAPKPVEPEPVEPEPVEPEPVQPVAKPEPVLPKPVPQKVTKFVVVEPDEPEEPEDEEQYIPSQIDKKPPERNHVWNPSLDLGIKIGRLWREEDDVEDMEDWAGGISLGVESLWGTSVVAFGFAVELGVHKYKREAEVTYSETYYDYNYYYGSYYSTPHTSIVHETAQSEYTSFRGTLSLILMISHVYLRPYVASNFAYSEESDYKWNYSSAEDNIFGGEVGLRLGKYWTHRFSVDVFWGVEQNMFDDSFSVGDAVWYLGLRLVCF